MAYINVDDNAESEAQAMAEADAESDPDADNSDKQIQEERVPFYIEHLPEATLFSKDDASNFQEEEREESSGML